LKVVRVVLQRVIRAHVQVGDETIAAISKGLLLLACIETMDRLTDIHWMAARVRALRIFGDAEGKMNLSLEQVAAGALYGVLVVSQFTLAGQVDRGHTKGNRPSFTGAAAPNHAIPLLTAFCAQLQDIPGITIEQGRFGADMQVELVNDGPATFILNSHPTATL
jgi:D-aminoacyl-tRNA deacylase